MAGFLSLKSKAFARGPPAREVPKVERKRIRSAYSSATSSLLIFFFFFMFLVVDRKRKKESQSAMERKRGERGAKQ